MQIVEKDFEKLSEKLIKSKYYKQSNRFKNQLIGFLNESYGIENLKFIPDLRLFVNAQSGKYAGEVNNLCGDIQLAPGRTGKKDGKPITLTQIPPIGSIDCSKCELLFDSLAFTDVLTQDRKTPEIALNRQLEVLEKLPKFKKVRIVSYDRLIDEKFINGNRVKQRWTIEEGDKAVRETLLASAYLDSQRKRLTGYELVMSCQGVDADQYKKCVSRVLTYCQSEDILGLGGWCILGRKPSYLKIFYETVIKVIPLIKSYDIKKVHIFGVTWYKNKHGFNYIPPLPPLLYLCDRYDIELSTDGTAPILQALSNDLIKSGATFPYWRDNLAWVKAKLGTLRESKFYKHPSEF